MLRSDRLHTLEIPAPEIRFIAHPTGGALALYRWGTVGAPAILLHHATGFCGRIWENLASEFSSEYCVFAFDARGHGLSTAPALALSWESYGEDLVWLAKQIAQLWKLKYFESVVGHSLGGTAAMFASQREPLLLPRVQAFEPVVLGDNVTPSRSRFSIRTRMRRRQFPSKEEAARLLRQDPSFKTWDADVFQSYLDFGFQKLSDGGIELACSPDVEAQVYELGATPVWNSSTKGQLMILHATISRFASGYQAIKAQDPNVTLNCADAGHLIPMEIPRLANSWLRATLVR